MLNKNIVILFALLLAIVSLCSCSSDEVGLYLMPKQMKIVSSGIIAENDNLTLSFDTDKKCILLSEKDDDCIWSTIPYDNYKNNIKATAMNSAISIEYFNTVDNSVVTEYSALCVEYGNVSEKKIKNGIIVTYYFKELQITIPVKYVLKKDGLKVSISSDEIAESGLTKLLAVSVSPNLCSVKNSDSKDSYLFIPCGCGALMYTDKDIQAQERLYSGEVYGDDASRMELDEVQNEEKITMPVFGVKSENHGIMGIIDGQEEAARIDASAGNTRYGYSRVYASFLTRGYDEVEQVIANQYTDTTALSKIITPNVEYSITYYPLKDKDASYVGMANKYQEVCINNGTLKQSKLKQEAFQIEIIGGIQKQKFTLGIPHNSNIRLTGYNEAKEIISDLYKETSYRPSVILTGYGKSGYENKYIAGNYELSNVFGSKKDRKELEKYCLNKKINLFTNFEIINYSKNSKGFSLFDTAKTAVLQVAAKHSLTANIRSENTDSEKVRFLKRSLLEKASDKLIDFADNNISGIALGNLGNCVYSDYSDEKSYMKSGYGKQTREIVSKVQESGHNTSLSSPGAFVAGILDSISDVSLQNGDYYSFDEKVPFYQIVYKGYIPLYSTDINFSKSYEDKLLRCAEMGVSPKYLLVNNSDLDTTTLLKNNFYSAVYESNKSSIVSTVAKHSKLYENTYNKRIVNHLIINEYITMTEYENGVKVFVNYSDSKQVVDGLEIESKSFEVF